MSLSSRIIVPALIGLLVFAGSFGCGGSSNNDQGTSFLGLGYFNPDDTEEGATGVIVPLSTDVPAIPVTLPTGVELTADGLLATVSMGVENRLANQFIRVVRIDCEYTVPGADPSLVIPTDSFATATVLQPNPDFAPDDPLAGGGGASSSSSTAAVTVEGSSRIVTKQTTGSQGFIEFEVLSPDLYGFLNANRNLLPQLPFRMVATCFATGVTQAGDVLVTNGMDFMIQFVELSECCTGGEGGGFQGGTGSGGSFSSFDAAGGGATSSASSASSVSS